MHDQRRPTRRKTSIRKGQQRPARTVDPQRFTRLSLAPSVRALLDRYGLQPQKGFGQNFLIDEFVLDQILEAAELSPSDQVVEVGTGMGVLTRALSERVRRVVAIEIDRGMIDALKDLFGASPNVTLVEGDALQIELAPHLDEGPYKVVANLPYYITSALLRRFFEDERRPTRIVVMVQWEVAQRIVAEPGDLSLLAVSVQYYGLPRIVGRVPASAFYPAPKVDSALLAVDVLPKPAVDVPADPFFKVVAAGFAMPRKQLHNTLAQRIWFPPGGAVETLQAVGIDPARRAETLSLGEWAELTRELVRRGAVE